MAKNDPIEKLLVGLGEANATTLAEIDLRIETKQKEIDDATEKLRKELGGLTALRKVIAVCVHGPKVRKSSKRKQETALEDDEEETAPVGEDLRNQIYDFLNKQKGPVSLKAISSAVGRHHIKVMHALKHEWFTGSAAGYEIART